VGDPDVISLGQMHALQGMRTAWWTAVSPGLIVVVTCWP
jgi:hypothetical protein